MRVLMTVRVLRVRCAQDRTRAEGGGAVAQTDALALCRCSRRLATSSPSSVVLTAVAERRSTFSDSFRSPSVRSSFVSSVGAGAAGGLAERRRPPARTEPVDNAGALP